MGAVLYAYYAGKSSSLNATAATAHSNNDGFMVMATSATLGTARDFVKVAGYSRSIWKVLNTLRNMKYESESEPQFAFLLVT